jgi:hypothetical protein
LLNPQQTSKSATVISGLNFPTHLSSLPTYLPFLILK